jgi:hypothetical protein
VSMPEASVHKDTRPILPKHQVRMSWQALMIQSIPESPFPQPTPHNHLRLRVLRPNSRHVIMTLLRGKTIHIRLYFQFCFVLISGITFASRYERNYCGVGKIAWIDGMREFTLLIFFIAVFAVGFIFYLLAMR